MMNKLLLVFFLLFCFSCIFFSNKRKGHGNSRFNETKNDYWLACDYCLELATLANFYDAVEKRNYTCVKI